MDWQLVGVIIGVFVLGVLCGMYAGVEGGIKRYRRDKKWKDWADRKRKGGEQ